MQPHHRNTALILAALSIPFGVAIYQDANADESDNDGFGRLGSLGLYDDDIKASDYDYDPYAAQYDDEEIEELLELYAANDDDEDEPTTMGTDFFNLVLFDGGKSALPTLSGPLASIKIGKSAAPFLEENPEADSWSYSGIPGFEDASLEIVTRYDSDRVNKVVLQFPDDGSAARVMTAQWGTPESTIDYDAEIRSWFNPEKKLRAELVTDDYGSAVVTLAGYTSVEEFIAPGSKIFGFEKKDLFDLSPKEIEELAGSDGAYLSVELPALSGMRSAPELDLLVEDDKIVEAQVQLSLRGEQGKDFFRLLKRKFGSASTNKDYEVTTYSFSKAGRIIEVELEDEGDNDLSLNLSFRRK